MTLHDRIRISIMAARYLEALERDDDAILAALWDAAASDHELLAAFEDIHSGLVEEQVEEAAKITEGLVSYLNEHLNEAEIVRTPVGPVTVADVADELFQYPPHRMPATAHQLNERLRSARNPLPIDLGLPKLVAWAEATFGPGSAEYWKAFREAAIKVRMRRNADHEFQLAARQTKPRPEGT